ncbi:SIS domain-containing protein [Geochorda subterranea]|uniref:SIS domain-containing protein n=1 Tax=Geochorda subterranea TaxID=3109564 RepID=A0ABZ1BR26_9FIRM|nr:SIS domain-containing protein [Limnochorda sp. LNt]WRP15128.1 SIS domain-containing protein [Limnochorda sp. LNt]
MNGRAASVRYLERAIGALRALADAEGRTPGGPIERAARLVAEAVGSGRLVHVFGSGHSHILAEEAFFRAGGILGVDPILETALMLHEGARKSTSMERLSGYARVIAEDREFEPGDVLIVASNSGRNAVPVELAQEAKRLGLKVIAITSVAHSAATPSRAPSGLRLFEVADVVVDNLAPLGDACLEVQGLDRPVGPLSTVTGAAILNAVMVRAIELLAARGSPPSVIPSANLQPADGEPDPVVRLPSRRGLRHL